MTDSFSTAHLEHCACPLCQSQQQSTDKQISFSPFAVVQCAECQLWYLAPRLQEKYMLQAYADPSYFGGGGAHGYMDQQGSYEEQAEPLRRTFRRFMLNLQSRGLTGGDLLEIGAGYGYLLEQAQPYFQKLSATDFDLEAVQQIQNAGFSAYHGGTEAIPDIARYHCIVSTGVIEHVYEPLKFVQDLREHLHNDGWIVFATPQMNSFWFKLQGKRWPSFKIPEHVTYFDRHTLGQLFQRAGAKEIRYIPYPAAYPLGLIADKLNLPLPKFLARYSLWLPATMFALAARFD